MTKWKYKNEVIVHSVRLEHLYLLASCTAPTENQQRFANDLEKQYLILVPSFVCANVVLKTMRDE